VRIRVAEPDCPARPASWNRTDMSAHRRAGGLNQSLKGSDSMRYHTIHSTASRKFPNPIYRGKPESSTFHRGFPKKLGESVGTTCYRDR
jgi:hypothetical protein